MNPVDRLTARQRQIAALLVREYSNKEIGAQLSCSEATVRAHLERMRVTLRVRTRTGIALLYDRAHRAESRRKDPTGTFGRVDRRTQKDISSPQEGERSLVPVL